MFGWCAGVVPPHDQALRAPVVGPGGQGGGQQGQEQAGQGHRVLAWTGLGLLPIMYPLILTDNLDNPEL